MPESTFVIIDTSDYMQNGDYPPSRKESQMECLHAVINGRLFSNRENVLGVLASGSKSRRVLSPLTNDDTAILRDVHQAIYGGLADVKTTLHVARLALEYSPEVHFGKRIVLFVGSPMKGMTQEDILEIAQMLKREGIRLDIISFGEVVENAPLLELLKNEMSDTCVYVPIPAGPHVMRDILATTEVIKRDGGLNMMGGMNDPELAAAMEESMRDYYGGNRQDYNEEAAIAAAIEASLREYEQPTVRPQQSSTTTQQPAMEEDELDEDEELRLAIELSMQEAQKEEEEKKDDQHKKDD